MKSSSSLAAAAAAAATQSEVTRPGDESGVSDKYVLCRARLNFEPRTLGQRKQVSNYLLLFMFVADRELSSCLGAPPARAKCCIVWAAKIHLHPRLCCK